MQLTDKVAVITGAAHGIGRAIAERFSAAGAHVALVDNAAEQGRDVAGNIDNAMFFEADVSQREDAKNVVDEVLKAHGRIDIVVNSAAILRSGDILTITENDFDEVFGVNVKGSMWISQFAARAMVDSGIKGSIVHLSSINAMLALPNHLAYNVTKGAINQLTRAMSLALAPHGIRVNAIAPGSINTEMLRDVMSKDDSARKQILSRTPLGRVGEAKEIAALALFLASNESSYITGEVIVADGGRMTLNYTVPVVDDSEQE